ncbi:hypothetical protein ZIOFF_017686 [Zingiber officinale]|uniref:Uncharacterized protein n=1 Tax=Zingiber officinale TaxID=94328 RepID=A0A8J5H5C8_ZINOF|nr:hypothetical protein ZIOFF_017686 [Zingiber officinale]
MAIDRRTDKLIRRTAMVGTATAAYLLLTADYVPQDNALLPIKRAIESAESSFKRYIFGSGRIQESAEEDPNNENSK